MNSIIKEDLISVVSEFQTISEKLRGKTILVTGSSGLIGHFTVLSLLAICQCFQINCTIIAHGRDIRKLQALYAEQIFDNNLILSSDKYLDLMSKYDVVNYIIHGACPTASKYFVEKPMEVIDAIYSGTLDILNLARHSQTESLVYLSSMEVYGQVKHSNKLSEEDLGALDIHALRASYPLSKRLSELMCVSSYQEWNVPSKIARLSMVFGPGVPKSDQRVLNYFVQQIKNRESIRLLTMGESRSCVLYLKDAVSGILYLMFYGENGQAYNVANPRNFYSIYEMAKTAASLGGIKVLLPKETTGVALYPNETSLNLDIAKIRKLGWEPMTDLKTIFERVLISQSLES